MKSASNGDVLKGYLQGLHVYVLLVASLVTGYMEHPGTDQHQSYVHHTSTTADLPDYYINDIVVEDTSQMFDG